MNPYEFDIRKLVYKPSHETLHWANKIEKEINKRLKDLTKYGIADYTIVETRDKKKQRIYFGLRVSKPSSCNCRRINNCPR